ncbi:MAG TPA: DinB family protein [Ignavibacteria bacterium]|nr:DinB family protein [Ignavibacteria bacterium]HMR40415.1 DinB family protein [Ignavibacteria bacterium]
MPLNEALIAELQQEAAATRKMLERVPEISNSWKPHEKSMDLGRLSQHIAEISTWVPETVDKDELDFAKEEYTPKGGTTNEELLKSFDENLANAIECLKNASDEKLMGNWTMKNGEKVYFTMPKIAVLRGFVFSHLIHHRGQLSVYLRMLDVPLPSVYGPTADEPDM